MNHPKALIHAASFLFLAGALYSQTAQDVLEYTLPHDGVRSRGGLLPNSEVMEYNIFVPGTDLYKKHEELPTRIGVEDFLGEQLVRRLLYRNDKKHGVQRIWHPNGQLASEEPYRDGRMDGLFRCWDEAGQLTAHYTIINGSGTERRYSPDGILIAEIEYKNGREDGTWMTYDMHDGHRSVLSKRKGRSVGLTFVFYKDGSSAKITCESDDGELHGPTLEFSPDGLVQESTWYVRDKKVDEIIYAVAAEKDLTLPPYQKDATEYKKLLNGPYKAAYDRYVTMPRVKIPLEFDEHGNPVPALIQPLQ